MSARAFLLLWILVMNGATSAVAQEPTRANGKVTFWQTNHLAGGQGMCVVRFGFSAGNLYESIETLTLAIRLIDAKGVDLGVATLTLLEPLGGSRGASYREAAFEGVPTWPHQDDGEISPLCYEGTRLIVQSAIGTQSGRRVDLVRFKQLEFTTFQKVNVQVGP
jgi:hypothetical protein